MLDNICIINVFFVQVFTLDSRLLIFENYKYLHILIVDINLIILIMFLIILILIDNNIE
jgi:uncharacterized protein YebE (UPF0316 family)